MPIAAESPESSGGLVLLWLGVCLLFAGQVWWAWRRPPSEARTEFKKAVRRSHRINLVIGIPVMVIGIIGFVGSLAAWLAG